MKIKCPCCNAEITIPNNYYQKHKEELLAKYRERMKDPEFVAYRRKVALKAYWKKKSTGHNV